MRAESSSSWLRTCTLSGIVGLSVGILAELARRKYHDYRGDAVARELEALGFSPPNVMDLLQPWVVPIVTTVIFLIVGLVIQSLQTVRSKRDAQPHT